MLRTVAISNLEIAEQYYIDCGDTEMVKFFEMAIKAIESWNKVIEEISSMNFYVSPDGQDLVLVADVLECIKRNIDCTAPFEVGDMVINMCEDSPDYGYYGRVKRIEGDTVEVVILIKTEITTYEDKDILHWAKIYKHNC